MSYTATMTRPRKSSSAFNSTTPQMNGPRIGGGPSQVGNGSQVGIGQASSGGSYGSPNGPNINGPQMVNGRRMTSNPVRSEIFDRCRIPSLTSPLGSDAAWTAWEHSISHQPSLPRRQWQSCRRACLPSRTFLIIHQSQQPGFDTKPPIYGP